MPDLAKMQKVARLRAAVESGELAMPVVDPSDVAAIASLNAQQLELMQAGLFVRPHVTLASNEQLRLPPGWDGAALSRLQSDYPDRWPEILRSLANQ
jgi:hypothetical protein